MPSPTYDDNLNAVQFAPSPSDDVCFIPALPYRFNRGVLDANGNPAPTEYNMHIDNVLYAEVGEERMKKAMRCSIHALNIIMSSSDPNLCPNPTNFNKFIQEIVSHLHRQLGYVINTRQMIVTIPDEKREAMLELLCNQCRPHQCAFPLLEAARLTLGNACLIVSSLPLGNVPLCQPPPSHLPNA
jgi:hypothetical protein